MENTTQISYSLRDYQENATENAERIFSREHLNRYAGVVLPTGAGKSFVAIQQLLSFNNPQYLSKERNRVINDSSMLYIAPTKEILSQVKLHIVKHVLLSYPNLGKSTVKDIDEMIMRDFPELRFKGINSTLGEDENPITDNDSKKEKLSAILRHISASQIDKMVKKAFPNLKFKCYAGIKGSEADISDDDVKSADFIVIDEAHRLGASKWRPKFESNIRENKKAKVLGITATPERTDKDGQDMMAEIARMIYPGETVLPDMYMTQELYVSDGIEDGVVTSPDKGEFDALLARSDEYQSILSAYNREVDEEERKRLGEILDKMEKIIGFSPRELTEEKLDEIITDKTSEYIANSILNANGKYVAFLPKNVGKNGDEKTDSAEYIIQWMERIKGDLKNLRDENGNPVKISFYVVSSNKEIRIDKNGLPTTEKGKGCSLNNSQMIKDFEDASSKTGGIKVLLTNDILNEGIHIEGIDGAIMYRRTDSMNVLLQQLGRCISSVNPDKPYSEQPKTQIIDTVGNTFKHIIRGAGSRTSARYDLYRLRNIENWIREHGNEFPDINRIAGDNSGSYEKALAENEARMAISLKRIKSKYMRYRDGDDLPLVDAEKVSEILQIADSINLWNIEIPARIVEPSEQLLTGNSFLALSEKQKRFMELYREGHKIISPQRPETRINKLLNIIRVLKRHNPNIKFPQGLQITTPKGEYLCSKEMESLSLNDFLRSNFSQKEIEAILVELQDFNALGAHNKDEIFYPGENYDLGEEIAFTRGKVWTSQYDWTVSNVDYFKEYSLQKLMQIGLLDDLIDDLHTINDFLYKETNKRFVNPEKNFLDLHKRFIPGTYFEELGVGLIKRFEECSLSNGQKYFDGLGDEDSGYDVYGYDKDGFNIYGFNMFGFDRKGTHRTTGTKWDNRGFWYRESDGKYINRETNTEYDLLGYNIYGFNEEGFERPQGLVSEGKHSGKYKYVRPNWHMRNEDGTYYKNGTRFIPACYSPMGVQHDANGFLYKPRRKNIYASEMPLLSDSKKGAHFFDNGASVASKSDEHAKECYYLELEKKDGKSYRVDIDGFDENGFKRVKVGKEYRYIHRDTSSELDKKGRRFNPKTLEPELDKDIRDARDIIKLILAGDDGAYEALIQLMSDGDPKLKYDVEQSIQKTLNRAFEKYQKYSPGAFSRDNHGEFRGLGYYYYKDINSSDKRDRIAKLWKLCPLARTIVEQENNRNLDMLGRLDARKRRLRAMGVEKDPLRIDEEQKKRLKSNAERGKSLLENR